MSGAECAERRAIGLKKAGRKMMSGLSFIV